MSTPRDSTNLPLAELAHLRTLVDQIKQERAAQEMQEGLEQRIRERTAGLEQAIVDLEAEVARRRQAEAALTASEQRYQLLYEDNPSMYFTLSQEGTVLSVNHYGAEQLGYSQEELTGHSILRVFDPQDHHTVLGQLVVCAASPSQLFQWEIQKVRKNGVKLWVRERARAIRDQAGRMLILVVCEDVTVHKQMECSLRESEQAIRSLQATTSAPGLTFEQRIQTVLELGSRRFQLPGGAFTKVLGDQLELSQVWPPTGTLIAGMRVPLCQTFCSAALQTDGPLSFEHAGASEWRHHPGYATFGLECYIGTKLSGQHTIYGTICFFGPDPRPCPFSEADKDFLLLMARWIVSELDRQEADRAATEQDRLLRSVIDTASDAIFMKDTEGRYLLINSFGANVIGRPVQDIIGKNDLELFPEETARRLMADDRQAFSGLREHHYEAVIPFEGQPRTFSAIKTPHRDQTGQVVGLVGISRDMTALKKTEEALRDSEERFKIAFRSSPHPVIITELATGRCLEVNDASLKLFGYRREEVVGQTTLALGLWPSLEDRAAFFQQLQTEGAVRNREVSLRSKDRTTRQLLITCEIIELDGMRCLITVGNDITEQKHAEAALRESEERFAKAFRSSPYPIVISELESGLCLDANDAAIHLFGYRPEEVTGKTDDQIGLWPTPDHRVRFVRQLKETGAVRNAEMMLRMKTGESRHCLISAEQIELNGKRCMVTIGYDVTEQRRAEKALRLTQAAVEKAADLAFWINRDAKILYVNDAACLRLGYQRSELLGMTVADIDPNYQPESWPQHWEALRQAGQLRYESAHRTKSGERYPVEIVANHVTFEGQEYNFAFVRDITEQKRAETALRDSEERWRTLFEHAGVGIAQLSLSGHFLRVNARLCQTLGYSSKTLLTQTFQALTHPDDLKPNLQHLNDLVTGISPSFSMEKRYNRSDGAWVWVNLTVSLVRSATGAPAYFIAVVEDISERKQAEEALRTSEIQWHQFVADAPVGLVIVDEQRRLLSANKAFCALTGYEEHEIIGKSSALYTHPHDLAENLGLTESFFRGERSGYAYEQRYIRKPGDIIWVSVKTTSIGLPGHRGPLLLAVVEDITQRKQAMEERTRISQDLHDDVLQSLYAVGMGLETTKARLTRISRSAAKRLEGSVTQLNGVIHEVRSFIPRMQSHAKDEGNFEQALRTLVGSFTATGAGDIAVDIDAAAAASLPLDSQRDLIGIAKEALSNSLRHTKASRRGVTFRRHRGKLRLEIADNGKGFHPSRSRKGMGLSNMRARAKKLGARLAIQSRPGGGTRIVLNLPSH